MKFIKANLSSLIALGIVIALAFFWKLWVRSVQFRSNDPVVGSEYRPLIDAKYIKDPLYRPARLLKELVKYDEDAPAKEVSRDKLSLGPVKVEYSGERIGLKTIFVGKIPAIELEGHITFGRAFKKSDIELLFFGLQQVATCCDQYRELYVIRNVEGLGWGIENLGVIHTAIDEDIEFLNRFRLVKGRVEVDLAVDSLRHEFVFVNFNGGNEYFSRPLAYFPVEEKSCDFLWKNLEEYLKGYKEGQDIESIFSLVQGSNVGRKNLMYIENTQPGYNSGAYEKVARRVLREGAIHPKLRALFDAEVCGSRKLK